MIAIVNISPEGTPLAANHEYEVRINRDVVARFAHNRPDGLAKCLELAAEAVKKQAATNQIEAVRRALLLDEGLRIYGIQASD